jgi:hypothetical protein
LRAASVALTWKVWEPLAKDPYVFGERQALKAVLSSVHRKVEPGSLEDKVNVAALYFTVPEGRDPEYMVVFC